MKLLNKILLLSPCLLLPFMNYGIDVGFSLKPYMLASLVVFFLYFKYLKLPALSIEMSAFLFFIFYFCMTSLWSEYVESSSRMVFLMIINLFCFSVIYACLNSYTSQYGLYDLVTFFIKFNLVIFSIAFVIYIITLFAYGNSYTSYEGSILGVFMVNKGMPRLVAYAPDPNMVSLFISAPLFLRLFLNRGKFDIVVLFFSLLLFMTWSRAAIAVLVVVLLFLILFNSMSFIKNFTFSYRTLIFVFLFTLIIYFSVEIFSLQELIERRLSDVHRASGRFDIWSNAIDIIIDNPYFGVGVYSFAKWNMALFNDAHHTHNTYLDILVESGIFGFTLFSISLSLFFVKILNVNMSLKRKSVLFSWLVFSLGMILSLSAISHEGFIFTLVFLSFLLSRMNFFEEQ
ncbi:hypothetical protein CTT30_00885 [Vibrio coralliilyticus]|nr:hypothetical protein CTT30_00885 [Vibrio coralliilyticus]